jgi:hypothetical protein
VCKLVFMRFRVQRNVQCVHTALVGANVVLFTTYVSEHDCASITAC